MLIKKIFLIFGLAVMIFCSINEVVLAEQPRIYKGYLPGPKNDDSKNYKDHVTDVAMSALTKAFLGIVGGLAIIFIIIGGIQYLGAMGNEDVSGKAKKTIMWAIGGLLIAIFSYAIVNIINNLSIGEPVAPAEQAPGSGGR